MISNKLHQWDKYPYYCLFVFVIIWILLAINPRDRFDWFLENLLVFALVTLLIVSFKRLRLSNFSYTLIFVFLVLHSIGAYYTYSEVPFISSIFNIYLERDNYDRLVHFLFGLIMFYPVMEVVRKLRIQYASKFFNPYLSFSIIVSFSSIYEIVEWITAIIVAPEAAAAFLGVQGDVFDAQKDMLMVATGDLIAFVISLIANRK